MLIICFYLLISILKSTANLINADFKFMNSTILPDFHIANNSLMIDVIIMMGPAIKNDGDACLVTVKKFVQNYRRIIIISPIQYFNTTTEIEWITDDILDELMLKHIGYRSKIKGEPIIGRWKHQQLIKLFSTLLIDNLLPNVLILDGEVRWRKQVTFLTYPSNLVTSSLSNNTITNSLISISNAIGLYTHGFDSGDQSNEDYNNFLTHVIPVLRKNHSETFIAHHVLIQRDILLSLMYYIEATHNQQFWYVFANSGRCSEYELYVRYSLYFYPKRTQIRDLKYKDTGNCDYDATEIDYISCHFHLRAH